MKLAAIAVLFIAVLPATARAACTLPAGTAGAIVYNSDYKIVQFCDGDNWVKLGGSTLDARIGTLTATKWCAANGGGTAIDCTQDAPSTSITLSGDVTGTGTSAITTAIADDAVTFAKIQNIATNKLLGRSTASSGDIEEITIGSGLSLSGGTLTASGSGTVSGTAGKIAKFTDTTVIGDSTFMTENVTGIGIGTAATSPLDVAGIMRSAGAMWSNGLSMNGTGSSSNWRLGVCDNTGDTNCPANGLVIHEDTVGTSMAFAPGGNVGIGTAAPNASALLDVASAATPFRGFLPPRMTTTNRDAITSPATGLTIYNTTNGQLEFYSGSVWSGIGSTTTGQIAAFALSSCPSGWTEHTAARGRFLRGIDPSGSTAVDPSGTRAPGNQQTDDLKGHTHTVGITNSTNVAGGYVKQSDGTGGTGSLSTSATGGTETRPKNVAVIFCQYSGSGNVAPASATVSGTTNYVAKFTGATVVGNSQIFDDGTNVGIGTASPDDAKLEIIVAGKGLSITKAAGATTDPIMTLHSDADGSGNPGAETFRVTRAGNVGIGTAGPGTRLTVVNAATGITPTLELRSGGTGSGDGPSFIMTDSAGEQDFQIYTDSANEYTRIQSLGAMAFHTSFVGVAGTNERMTISSTGNVGIGTATPDAKLTIGNNVATGSLDTFAEYQMLLFSGGTAAGSYGFGVKSNTMVFNSGAGAFSFDRNGTATTMTMDTSGNVGIGTASPAAKLTVVGTNGTTGFRVYTSDGTSRYATMYPDITGNIYFQSDSTHCVLAVSSTSWSCPSDARLKENVHDLQAESGLDAIVRLRPVTFNMTTDSKHAPQIGFIAQEVEGVFPELVSVSSVTSKLTPDGTRVFNQTGLIAPLVKAVQELKSDNDNLRAANEKLDAENDNQDVAIEALRAEIKALKAAIR